MIAEPRMSGDARRGLAGRIAQAAVGQSGLLVTLLWTIPFFWIPFGLLLVYSFGTQDYLTARMSFGWTLESWRALYDPVVYNAFLRSVELSTAATIGCAILGYPLAYFVARHAGRFRSIALFLIVAPFWVSFIVRAYAWIAILGPTGPINHVLRWVGVGPVALINNNTGIGIGIVYSYLPLMVFPIFLSLDRIDTSVLEAARDLGASPFATFRRVIFPQSLPGLVAGSTIVWIPALGEYVIPTILGGGKTFMIGNVIGQYFTESFQWPLGAALAAVLVIFALVALLIVLALVRGRRWGQAMSG